MPSTSSPPGASRAHRRCQTAATSPSSYWRSTFAARISTGRSGSGISKPPCLKVSPSRSYGFAAATRSGEISMPTTAVRGSAPRSRSSSSTAVQGAAPYPRSTATGVSARRRAGPWVAAIQRSMRRSRFGLVVPRVAVPMGRMAQSVTSGVERMAQWSRGDAPDTYRNDLAKRK